MVSPIFASHSLKASFKLYDGLGQCKHLLGTLLTSLYFGYSVLNPILVTVLDRVYSGTLDLQKLLPDLTRSATIPFRIHSGRRVSASRTCKVRRIGFSTSRQSNVWYFRLTRHRASA